MARGFCAWIATEYNLSEGWALIKGVKCELLDNDDPDRFDEDYDNPDYVRVHGPDGDDALYQADKWVAVDPSGNPW